MTRDEFREFLQRYKEGKCSHEEVQKVDRWFEDISDDTLELTELEKNAMRKRMLHNIRPQIREERALSIVDSRRFLRIAASVAAILLAGYFFANRQTLNRSSEVANVDHINVRDTAINNLSRMVLVHTLPDGSLIELQPGSTVSYVKEWSSHAREVRLVGEAFFQVEEDTSRPFFVYGGDIVTKVLGTSFRVKAPESADRIEVEVKTGKVSVYEDPSGKNQGDDRDASGVILTPNEKVQYYVSAGHWVTSLVDRPQPVSGRAQVKTAFVFSGTPVKNVFQRIEAVYDIDIIIENENAYTCTFTGDVSSMELYNVLKVVCRSINATYEVKGTKILVSGSGCVR